VLVEVVVKLEGCAVVFWVRAGIGRRVRGGIRSNAPAGLAKLLPVRQPHSALLDPNKLLLPLFSNYERELTSCKRTPSENQRKELCARSPTYRHSSPLFRCLTPLTLFSNNAAPLQICVHSLIRFQLGRNSARNPPFSLLRLAALSSQAMPFDSIKLNSGSMLPGIAFGTGEPLVASKKAGSRVLTRS
jgi:hypothetical protein